MISMVHLLDGISFVRPCTIPMLYRTGNNGDKFVLDTTVVAVSAWHRLTSLACFIATSLITFQNLLMIWNASAPRRAEWFAISTIFEQVSTLTSSQTVSDLVTGVLRKYAPQALVLSVYVTILLAELRKPDTREKIAPIWLRPSNQFMDFLVRLFLGHSEESQEVPLSTCTASLSVLYSLLLDSMSPPAPEAIRDHRRKQIARQVETLISRTALWIIPKTETLTRVPTNSVSESSQNRDVDSPPSIRAEFNPVSLAATFDWLSRRALHQLPQPIGGATELLRQSGASLLRQLEGSKLPAWVSVHDYPQLQDNAQSSMDNPWVRVEMTSSLDGDKSRRRGIFGMDHVLLNILSRYVIYNQTLAQLLSDSKSADVSGDFEGPLLNTWGNLGFWTPGQCYDYPQACERLLIEVLIDAGLLQRTPPSALPLEAIQLFGMTHARNEMLTQGPCERSVEVSRPLEHVSILDVACGSGDQLLATASLLINEGRVSASLELTGVNLVTAQVAAAKQLVFARRRAIASRLASSHMPETTKTKARRIETVLADKLQILEGDATKLSECKQLPQSARFTHVLCLDAAYHFSPTRSLFFAGVHKHLMARGRIALTDLVLHPSLRSSILGCKIVKALSGIASIPGENLLFEDEYVRQLEANGFTSVRIRYIEEHVFPGFERFTQTVLAQSGQSLENMPWNLASWMSPSALRKFKITAAMLGYLFRARILRYAVISATKSDRGS